MPWGACPCAQPLPWEWGWSRRGRDALVLPGLCVSHGLLILPRFHLLLQGLLEPLLHVLQLQDALALTLCLCLLQDHLCLHGGASLRRREEPSVWVAGRATAAVPRAPWPSHPWVDGARHLLHQGEPMERAPKQGCFPAQGDTPRCSEPALAARSEMGSLASPALALASHLPPSFIHPGAGCPHLLLLGYLLHSSADPSVPRPRVTQPPGAQR